MKWIKVTDLESAQAFKSRLMSQINRELEVHMNKAMKHNMNRLENPKGFKNTFQDENLIILNIYNIFQDVNTL